MRRSRGAKRAGWAPPSQARKAQRTSASPRLGALVDGEEGIVDVGGAAVFFEMGRGIPALVVNEVFTEGGEALGAGFEEAVDAGAEEGIAEGGGVELAEEGLARGFRFETRVEERDDEGRRIGGDIFEDEGGAQQRRVRVD